jgi:hypothetical protein
MYPRRFLRGQTVTAFGKFCFLITCSSAALLAAQYQRALNPPQPIAIRATRLIDGRHEAEISAAVILSVVEGPAFYICHPEQSFARDRDPSRRIVPAGMVGRQTESKNLLFRCWVSTTNF